MNNALMFFREKDNWETPQYLYDELNDKFHFTLDPCADKKIINVNCIIQKNRTVYHRIGKGI